ncbi:hypothetical protein [Thermovibrio sp.]
MKRALAALLLLFVSSCGTYQVNGNFKFRLIKIGEVEQECRKFEGKDVYVRAKYLGWSCPPECKAPPITRSDTCFVDETGCIYAYGLGGLDPIKDRGKSYLIKAKVLKKGNRCYLKVISKDEVK